QPGQGLLAETGSFLIVEGTGVLPLTAAREGGGASSAVAVCAFKVLRQFRTGSECLGIEAGCRGLKLLVPPARGQRQLLSGVSRLGLALENLRQLALQVDELLGPTDPLG